VKRLTIKLVKSICYYYLLKRLLVKLARLIRKIIVEIRRFVKKSAFYIAFNNLKRSLEKDQVFINIFKSFLRKLDKGKRYISVENLTKINNPNQIFKVFKEGAFVKNIYILADTSDILGLLLERESLKLERVY